MRKGLYISTWISIIVIIVMLCNSQI